MKNSNCEIVGKTSKLLLNAAESKTSVLNIKIQLYEGGQCFQNSHQWNIFRIGKQSGRMIVIEDSPMKSNLQFDNFTTNM